MDERHYYTAHTIQVGDRGYHRFTKEVLWEVTKVVVPRNGDVEVKAVKGDEEYPTGGTVTCDPENLYRIVYDNNEHASILLRKEEV